MKQPLNAETAAPKLSLASKGKSVRFSMLAEGSGKPEVVTLWADPKKDCNFMQLVKQRRVITVVQKPTGNKKDFGYVGFHPQPFAVFMVFPKALQPPEGTPVIGIKYELLETPKRGKASRPTVVKAPVRVEKHPVMKSFKVQLLRTLSQVIEKEVTGLNRTEAGRNALSAALEETMPAGMTEVNVRIAKIKESF